MLILRPVAESDLDAIVALAQQLDSMNLPSDRDRAMYEAVCLRGKSYDDVAREFELDERTVRDIVGCPKHRSRLSTVPEWERSEENEESQQPLAGVTDSEI